MIGKFMSNIMKKWPDWAWVGRHAENSKNDQLVMTGPGSGHVFPHSKPMWYCCRTWTPQEYIDYRLKMLQEMAEDVQKLINLFSENDVTENEQPLIEDSLICPKCGSKVEMFTSDLDWCPKCHTQYIGN
jgi:hypothetical protein